MYMEGSTKAFLVIAGVVLIVVASAFWSETLFTLQFLWDLLVLNLQPLLQHLGETLKRLWPF
jgi:hypothetical protein